MSGKNILQKIPLAKREKEKSDLGIIYSNRLTTKWHGTYEGALHAFVDNGKVPTSINLHR